jgi:glycosyltransferase involved in cell wall biosynthesis
VDVTRITVVIPVYNAATTIAAAVESVWAVGFPDTEIVLVDDGSTDAGLSHVASRVSRILTQPQSGPSAARNTGLATAGGEIIGFLDADDIWEPDGVRAAFAAMAASPVLGAVQGRVRDWWQRTDGDHLDAPRYAYNLGAALFRRAAIEQVSGFDPALHSGEDIDLWIRLRNQGWSTKRIPEVTLHYRRRETTITTDVRDDYYRRLARLLHASIKRTGGNQQHDEHTYPVDSV